jgi:hypothetical protein
LVDEVQAEHVLDFVPVDGFGPRPVEVGDGFESANATAIRAPLEASPRTVCRFGAYDVL